MGFFDRFKSVTGAVAPGVTATSIAASAVASKVTRPRTGVRPPTTLTLNAPSPLDTASTEPPPVTPTAASGPSWPVLIAAGIGLAFVAGKFRLGRR